MTRDDDYMIIIISSLPIVFHSSENYTVERAQFENFQIGLKHPKITTF